MGVTLILTSTAPTQTDAGLDQLIERYKTQSSATDVMTDGLTVPQRYSDHPVHSGMVLMDRRCQETGPSACELMLTYQGVLNGPDGTPGALPVGKHSDSYTVQSAQVAATGGLSMTVEALVPTHSYTWLDTQEGIGAGAVPDFAPNTPAAGYIITGKCISTKGSNVIMGGGSASPGPTSFLTQVRVGDVVVIDLLPTEFITAAIILAQQPVSWTAKVVSVASNIQFTVDRVAPASCIPFRLNHSYGIHAGSGLPVKIVAIRMGCGFASIFTNPDVTVWGPIILASYFFQIAVPSVSSEELVPSRYWRNTERNTLQLTPIPCT